ncbi:MAG: DNA polymerase III subunit delta' [Terracidiphilus sp.]|nr:DNA polymerase III subunit delta' [Terracidiphilus sp.]MDR3775899.1 DNA polymerase III subunit delta' [Terracidiphilus sp.]
MGFQDFLGNPHTVTHLRESIHAERFPHSLILAGPRGAGKYTLALMLAKAVNCLHPTETDGLPDFCGVCSNCTRIADSENLEARVAEAVEAREAMRDADKRDTRILIQTHPDVLIVPPDPPQLMIKMAQVRQVIHVAYYRPPVESKRSFSIFTSSAFMKEAANSLLKVLEEPPEHTSLILLTENPQELLPTIRSRAVIHRLGAIPSSDLEGLLALRRPELNAKDRALAARLAEGAVGRALTIDLGAYVTSRQDALLLLRTALREPDYTALFHATETYRAGADGQEKTISLLRALGSLMEDLLLVIAGSPQLIRNLDLANELERMAQGLTVDWIDEASRALSQVEQGMRRNLLRSISLDAMAFSLDRS